MFSGSEIKEITLEQSLEIIERRFPKGLFYTKENGVIVGIDNRKGHAWTEDFSNLDECFSWLME